MCWSRNRPGGHECAAAVQYGTGTADVAAGRAVLRQAGLGFGRQPCTVFIAPGRKYPQPYGHCRRFDRNGKSAGIWLNPLTTDDGNGLRGFSGEGRVKGSRGCAVRGPAG